MAMPETNVAKREKCMILVVINSAPQSTAVGRRALQKARRNAVVVGAQALFDARKRIIDKPAMGNDCNAGLADRGPKILQRILRREAASERTTPDFNLIGKRLKTATVMLGGRRGGRRGLDHGAGVAWWHPCYTSKIRWVRGLAGDICTLHYQRWRLATTWNP